MAILKLYKYICVIAFSTTLTGCFTDFTPEVTTDQVLCLNAIITAGEPIEADVTHTWTYTDVAGEINHTVDDAIVSIFVNGEKTNDGYLPKPGDRIRIEAVSQRYGSSAAEVEVPVSTPLKDENVSVVVTRTGIGHWVEFHQPWDPEPATDPVEVTHVDFTYSIALDLIVSDPGPGRNYFRANTKAYYEPDIATDNDSINISMGLGSLNYEIEPIFSEHLDPLDALNGPAYGFNFFTDRRFESGSYTLHLRFSNSNISVTQRRPFKGDADTELEEPDLEAIKAELEKYLDMSINVIIESVSESYYNWANYSWQTDGGMLGDLSNVGLTDAVWGYSNTSSGAGIVAARTPAARFINLRPYLLQALRDYEF